MSDKLFWIEYKHYPMYYVCRFRSWLNGTYGPWRDTKEEAEDDGKHHARLVEEYYITCMEG